MVERVNGTFKGGILKFARSHTDIKDWVLIMRRAMALMLEKVSSVTKMSPVRHFTQFNKFSRLVTPIDSNDRVVITVQEVEAMNTLQWIDPVELLAYDAMETDNEDTGDDVEVTAEVGSQQMPRAVSQRVHMVDLDEEGGAVLEPDDSTRTERLIADRGESESEDGDLDDVEAAPMATAGGVTAKQLAAPMNTTVDIASSSPAPRFPHPPPSPTSSSSPSCSSPPPPSASAMVSTATVSTRALRRRQSYVSTAPSTDSLSILPVGVREAFREAEWDKQMRPEIRSWLRRVGCIANGDCGPASAYFVQHGMEATAEQAAKMRTAVLLWSETGLGQEDYASHSLQELRQVPADLPTVQEMWSKPRCWVTTEFFTVFGGMIGAQCGYAVNVFVLYRCIRPDSSTGVNVQLVTNGGRLILNDHRNSYCVYFQFKSPQLVGHFEPVCDKNGQHRWRADSQIVQECLFLCMRESKSARASHDARSKMLTAAHNRINVANETLSVGDCAWLTVPDKVAEVAMALLRKGHDKVVVGDGKLLVKIARIHNHDAVPGQSPLATQLFEVWTEHGRVESAYPIDQLKLSRPPPDASVYKVVDLVLDLPRTGKADKHIKLVQAYKRHLTWIHERVTMNTRLQVNTAVGVANTPLQVVPSADGGPAVCTHLVAADADDGADRPLTPPPPPPSSTRPTSLPPTVIDLIAAVTVDESPLSCTHCDEMMEFSDCTFCFYTPCHAPIHGPERGCANEDMVHVTDEFMRYCSEVCLLKDRGASSMRQPRRRVGEGRF